MSVPASCREAVKHLRTVHVFLFRNGQMLENDNTTARVVYILF